MNESITMNQTLVVSVLNVSDNVSLEIYAKDSGILLSDVARSFFILVNHVVMSTLICLFGLVGNCFNIMVFLRQGLRKSMNLTLCAISVSDLIGLTFQIWHNFCLNPYVGGIDTWFDFSQVQYLTAGWPNMVAVRITGWTTAFMTLERCLSIALPLKIKQIVTFRRTVGVIFVIYALNTSSMAPLYMSSYISWYFEPQQNSTKLGVAFRTNKLEMQGLMFIFNAFLTFSAFLSVVIFTTILVFNLRQKSQWRKQATCASDQSEAVSTRERKTVILAVAVASVLIVCYTPAVVCSVATSIEPDFGITGKQANVFHAVWSFAFLLHSINSSINVAVYYRMSSKYRQTFQEIFFSAKNKKVAIQSKHQSDQKF